ncbi:DUF1292 domain-containing protein [Clostridium sp. BJN0001]|uniref:DUF1292 domain-containing protein n=1 Tax=Clostridium sp. BJN0001 TaxID=2930219 RepID=UPI001FD2306B|nr:DUF1292 domain-containing protein [Clostridium sp. BJN0001]
MDKDKDLEKCNCTEESEECSCNCNHDEKHECNCGCEEEKEQEFVIDLEDENGEKLTCKVVDAFKFEGNEYMLVQNPKENTTYLFKVADEDLIVPDEDEFNKVVHYYENEMK